MNQRLVDQYKEMELQNKEKFLNNDLELDTTWGKEIWGVTLQIDLSEKVRDVLCEYQDDLDQLEPNNFLLLPRQYQHISFNQVVFWGGQYSLGNEGTWNSVTDDFTQSFLKMNQTYQSFEVTFSKLIVTTAGIVWTATDSSDQLEDLRNVFLKELHFPAETTKQNHIIHTTVARYKNKLNDPKKVLSYIEAQNREVTMKIEKIILRKELVFPSIKTEEIASISPYPEPHQS